MSPIVLGKACAMSKSRSDATRSISTTPVTTPGVATASCTTTNEQIQYASHMAVSTASATHRPTASPRRICILSCVTAISGRSSAATASPIKKGESRSHSTGSTTIKNTAASATNTPRQSMRSTAHRTACLSVMAIPP